MRVALGSDHGGFELKQEIIKYLEEKQIAYKDYGCHSTESTITRFMPRRLHTAFWMASVILEFWYAEPESAFPLQPTRSREFVPLYVQTALPQRQQDFTMMPTSLHLEDVW